MSELATPATTIQIEDGHIFSFLDTFVGTLDKTSYTDLVTRLLANTTVTPKQKAKLMVTAIHQGRPEHLTVLFSLGIGLVDDHGCVVDNGCVYSLSKVFTEDIAKILLENLLGMCDAQFDAVRRYYQNRKTGVGFFDSLYKDPKNHTSLAVFFIRLRIVPETLVPLKVAMTCGRAGIFEQSTKALVLDAIAMQDQHSETEKEHAEKEAALILKLGDIKWELSETKKELSEKEAVLNMAHKNLKLILAESCARKEELDIVNGQLAEIRGIVKSP